MTAPTATPRSRAPSRHAFCARGLRERGLHDRGFPEHGFRGGAARRPDRAAAAPGRRSTAEETGATAVLVVALVGVVLLLGLAASFVVATAATHRRAQSGADLAALAGATALQRGQDPCAAVTRVASGNEVVVVDCVVQGEAVTVEVRTPGPEFLGHSFEAVGRARAGPITSGLAEG